jgi:prepilin-type N-terminal cleavage/methylation domain-containing protein
LEKAYAILLISIFTNLWGLLIKMVRKVNGAAQAFTIVELLIVIVVIGILAAVTIVAYNGVTSRAAIAGVQSDLESTAKIIENAKSTSSTSTYPVNQAAAQTAGMISSVTYTAAMNGYCATESANGAAYMVTSANAKVHTGLGCTSTNLVTNPSFESATVLTTGWTAAANAAISRTTAYSSNGTASMQVVRNATASNGYISTPLTTTPGRKYSISFDVRTVTGSPSLTATVKSGSATGASPADATTITISPTTSFTKYFVTWTADNAASYFVLDDGTISTTYVIDSVMAVDGDNTAIYTDPTLTGSTWTWTGTAYNSTSTGPAF